VLSRGGDRGYDAAMDRLKIPTAISLLGLSFTACEKGGDPLVGTWDVVSVDGVAWPYTVDGYYGGSSVFKVDMTIKEDHSGTYTSRETYSYPGEPDDVDSESYPLTVDDSNAPEYILVAPGAGLVLTCTVDGSTMACEDVSDGSKSRFKKR